MESLSRNREFGSATPGEIREGLGLSADATHQAVIAERTRLYDLSLAEVEVQGTEGEPNA